MPRRPTIQSPSEAVPARRLLAAVLADAGYPSEQRETSGAPNAADFILRIDPAVTPKPEGYRLDVTATGVVISGRDAAGAFYGVETLRQLIAADKSRLTLPYASIRDWPRPISTGATR